jgi:hypothetical protein
MAREIAVHRAADMHLVRTPPTADVHSPRFEAWCGEVNARVLSNAPLGSESAIREFAAIEIALRSDGVICIC